jgi:hypothetical protein
MAIRILEGSLPWAPELRASMSRLMYAFESAVRTRSGGEVSLFVDDAVITRDHDKDTILFSMGKTPDLFEWVDERDESLNTQVAITLYMYHTVDSVVDLFRSGEDEPFTSFPLRMDTFGDDLANAVPGLFPNNPEMLNQRPS